MADTHQSGSIMPVDSQISVNINGKSFNIWDEGVTEVFAQYKATSQKATWTCRCLWQDRLPLAQAILGGSTNLAGTTIFANGWQYPYNPNWYAQNIQIKGDGFKQVIDGVAILGYQRAELTTTFGIPDFSFGSPLDIGDDELEFNCETINLPSEAVSLVYNNVNTDPVPIGQVRSIDVGIIGYNRCRYNMAVLPINTVRRCINAVNTSQIFGGAPGTVKFVGGKSRRKITAAGDKNWDITFSFSENINGWNKLWKAGVGFTDVNYIGSADSLFKTADLTQIFASNAD